MDRYIQLYKGRPCYVIPYADVEKDGVSEFIIETLETRMYVMFLDFIQGESHYVLYKLKDDILRCTSDPSKEDDDDLYYVCRDLYLKYGYEFYLTIRLEKYLSDLTYASLLDKLMEDAKRGNRRIVVGMIYKSNFSIREMKFSVD